MNGASVPALDVTAGLEIKRFDLREPAPGELTAWLAAHQPHPIFATPEWFVELSRFQDETDPASRRRAPFWLVLYRDGAPLVAAPIEYARGPLGIARLSLFTNFYAPVIDLVLDREKIGTADAWICLLWAFDQLYPGWVSFRATPLRGEQRRGLDAACTPSHAAFSYEVTANYQAAVPSIAQYWEARPSLLRSTLKRKGKKLRAMAHRFELTAAPSVEQIAHYWEIYQHSWKHQEPSRRFINWLLAWGTARGYVRLGLLYVGLQVVACQLWLVKGRTAYIFKLAQALTANQFSPGSLLSEYMIDTLAAQDGIERIDYLLGDDEFKAMWMDGKEPIFWVEIFNRRSLAGRVLSIYHRIRNRSRPTSRGVGMAVRL